MSGTSEYTGSDLVALRSSRIVRTLLQEFGDLGKLDSAFGTSTASRESCSATATLIMEKVSTSDWVGGRMTVHVPAGFFKKATTMPMSMELMIAEIMRLLDGPNVIYVWIAKDHHFVLFPIDDSRMGIVQGFQGSYTVVDWFAWRGIGAMTKSEFRAAFTKLLTSSSQQAWTAAALELFSFNLAKRTPGNTKRSKDKVAQDIRDWFTIKPFIKGYGYKAM